MVGSGGGGVDMIWPVLYIRRVPGIQSVNVTTTCLKQRITHFLPVYSLAKVPVMSLKEVRKLCAGVNQLNLATHYLQLMADHKKTFTFRGSIKTFPNYYLLQAPTFTSRMKSGKTYAAYLLFDKKTLVDSMCTCQNMARSTPCAHRGTVLLALHNKHHNISLTPKPTRSVRQRDNIKTFAPSFAGGWKNGTK